MTTSPHHHKPREISIRYQDEQSAPMFYAPPPKRASPMFYAPPSKESTQAIRDGPLFPDRMPTSALDSRLDQTRKARSTVASIDDDTTVWKSGSPEIAMAGHQRKPPRKVVASTRDRLEPLFLPSFHMVRGKEEKPDHFVLWTATADNARAERWEPIDTTESAPPVSKESTM